MITKELLSEVLGCEILEVGTDRNYITFYSHTKFDFVNGNRVFDTRHKCYIQYINIYELAHKCKELARDREYFIRSFYDYVPTGAFAYISAPNHNGDVPKTGHNSDTEPEAIFRAYQWVLENKKDLESIKNKEELIANQKGIA